VTDKYIIHVTTYFKILFLFACTHLTEQNTVHDIPLTNWTTRHFFPDVKKIPRLCPTLRDIIAFSDSRKMSRSVRTCNWHTRRNNFAWTTNNQL